MSAAVVAWAVRTSLGNEVSDFVNRLMAGERAAAPNRALESIPAACKIHAPLMGKPQPSEHRRFLSRLELFALDAAREALGNRRADPDRLGIFWATGGLRIRWAELAPALAEQRLDGQLCWERGLRRLHPFWLLQHLSNNAHALLSVDVQARGEGATFGGANAGAQAIAQAEIALSCGAIDLALVVACDSLISPEALVDGVSREALTTRNLRELAAPYDVAASGAFPGEAAAALLLERVDTASSQPKAVVHAFASADGERGHARPGTLGAAVARVRGGGEGACIVDGCGLAQPQWDLAEREALASVIDPGSPLTCTSAATGQLGAATALLQVVALAHVLSTGAAYPISGLNAPVKASLRTLSRAQEVRVGCGYGVASAAPGLLGVVRVVKPSA